MSIWQQTSSIYRKLTEVLPGAGLHACALNIPRQDRAWLGFIPKRVVKISRSDVIIEDNNHSERFRIDAGEIFDRLHEFIDPQFPVYFVISADLHRAVADPDLPLVMLSQPSLEIELSGANNEPVIHCENPELYEQIKAIAHQESTVTPIPAYRDTDKDSWNREPESDVLARLKAAIGILQEKDGKIIVMRSADKDRNLSLDPFRLYEIYSSLEPGCAAGHIYNLGADNFSIGMSPENIFVLEEGKLLYDVVASTRGKSADPDTDQRWKKELQEDPKERLEHEMALSRYKKRLESLCTADSVQLHEHMQIMDLHCIRHLVSRLSGTLSPGQNVFNLLKQHFPPLASYPDQLIPYSDSGLIPWYYYGGMVGRIGPDLNTAHCYLNIRATLLHEDKIHIQAGAGVIRQSQPKLELLEISNKLKCLSDAIARWEREAL